MAPKKSWQDTTSSRVDLDGTARRVLKARIRLSLSHPFLATSIMRLPVVCVRDSVWCKTASTDGYHVFYNPAWMQALKDEEIRGVLAHEVLHVLFAHADRRGIKGHKAWNVACDFAINLLLVEQGFKLPRGGLISKQFGGMTAEQIFHRLGLDQKSSAKKSAKAKDHALATEAAGSGEAGELPELGDDLLDPTDPQVRPWRDPNAPDPQQMDELRKELRDDAMTKLQGAAAAAFGGHCEAAGQRHVDWRALLRAWLTERIKGDWVSYPFSKRHLHRGLFMPSPGMNAPGHVVFAIDTSGSMSEQVLGDIVSELQAFRETFPCRLSVLQADAKVQSVTHYEAMDGMEIPQRLQVVGRGGTHFKPVFDWVQVNAPDAIVLYATDGFGTFPPTAPPNPVIWLLTPAAALERDVPFGGVVRLGGTKP